MIKQNWLIISFAATTEALQAEKLFLAAGLSGQLIPTPTSISASCGLCWRAKPEEQPQVEALLQTGKIRAEQLRLLAM